MLPFILATDAPFSTAFTHILLDLSVSINIVEILFNHYSIHISSFITFITTSVNINTAKNQEISTMNHYYTIM